MTNWVRFLLISLVIFGFGLKTDAHTVTLRFQTQTTNGRYAPEHVLAVWIEDNEGNFVKSCKIMARRYRRILVNWRRSSGENTVDAVTGATMFNHQNHVIEWDCTDKDGNHVPDGNYKVFIEFSETNNIGPTYSLDFKVSSNEFEVAPEDQRFFKNIALSYKPE